MWTNEQADFRTFETSTWQRGEPNADGELWRALAASSTTALGTLEDSTDARMKQAAAAGMRCGVLVPVREGIQPLAVIELLSTVAMEPSEDLTTSLEAVAFQLGHFAHLLRIGATPQWRLGKLTR